MNRVIGRSLREIRYEFGLPLLPGRAVSTALHEAAHATVALAHGVEVTGVWVRAKDSAKGRAHIGSNWYGNCDYRTQFTSTDAEREMAVAGIAAASFADSSIDSDWSSGGESDVLALVDLGIDAGKALDCLDAAIARLSVNQGILDRIASELLTVRSDGTLGTLSESDIRRIATPGMRPDDGTSLPDWTPAQRQRMADDLEAVVRSGNMPPALRTLLDEYQQSSTPGRPQMATPPDGIRYGAPVPITPTSPGRYDHRMLRGAR